MRIALVYDCLYPHTVGGAERWYRSLAERLSERHQMTYLTRRQWDPSQEPGTPFETVVVAPGGPLYTSSGRRRIVPPLRFGWGVFWHLLRHAGRYDIVHTASFPYFSLIGAWLALRIRRRGAIVVDWHEVWTREYWSEYLGPAGWLGWAVQRLCVRIPQTAFCFSRLHADRLRGEGYRGALTVLKGEYSGPLETPEPGPAKPLVVFAGRHIPEKRVTALVPALALARRTLPELRCEIYGDGPDRAELERLIEVHGLGDAVDVRGRVGGAEVGSALDGALCMVLPSRREGYGLVVVEAAARGTPSVVVRAPDNAATELVEDGENGMIAPSASAEDLAAAILRVHALGEQLRASTAAWFGRNARRLSLDASLETVAESYSEVAR
jgi:glycosyltransferase involved in cell wall biosynthesis